MNVPREPQVPPQYPSDRLMSRLELLRQVYNEQLDQLVRTETDFTLFERLALLEPNNEENVQRRTNLKKGLEIKQHIVEIIEGKIKDEEKKNGKEN